MNKEEIITEAQEAFWWIIAKHHPEVESGDFPFDAQMAFYRACEQAYKIWLEGNQPDKGEK